ncbi:MAG: hypothetical protein P0120_01795 [Nitrospira sp.]|nr:hypothetical protein [Nitrospira sp.]
MGTENGAQSGTLKICLADQSGMHAPIRDATVKVLRNTAGSSAQQGKGYEEGEGRKKGQPAQHVDTSASELVREGKTDAGGCFSYNTKSGSYRVVCEAFGKQDTQDVTVTAGCATAVDCRLDLGFSVETVVPKDDCTRIPCGEVRQGKAMYVRVLRNQDLPQGSELRLSVTRGTLLTTSEEYESNNQIVREYVYDSKGVSGAIRFKAVLKHNPEVVINADVVVLPDVQSVTANTTTTMSRTETEPTDDLPLWVVIRNSTEALSFNNYLRFMDWIFCGKDDRANLKEFELGRFNNKRAAYRDLRGKRSLPFTDTDAYRVVKAATEAFVMVNCGVFSDPQPFTAQNDRDLDEDYLDRRDIPVPGNGLRQALGADYLETVDGTSTLPYLAIIRRKLPDIPIKTTQFEEIDGAEATADNCFGILQEKLANPCLLELIWSYWHEEGMLVQTVNAITRRFQNVRGLSMDPLSNLEIDPLRPLNNLFWGYIQDEQHRLTVPRRNYEYDHHYGLRLEGQAVQQFRPADTRSKFLESFHHLLRLCTVFYKQDDDTTVKADAFPVLNALKETHLILSQGAHNQFGDLPSTARVEMLMQEWLLARPEFREYLPARIMVAYPEPWMDRVDAMKKLQGWSDTSVLHFRNLGIFGEQLLLSIRWGAWSDIQEPIQAFNWARFFRPQVQGYIHAYRAVTGVDLAAETVDTQVNATLPSVLLKKRLAMQTRA